MTSIDLTVPRLQHRSLETLPVAIIGAGPVGLAAATNLVERGIEFVIYESGDGIASSIRQWGHTRLFSPWKHVVDPASRRLLEATEWQMPAPMVSRREPNSSRTIWSRWQRSTPSPTASAPASGSRR